MERRQTGPAPGVLRSRPGRRSLGLVERVGGVRGFVGLFTLTPGSSPGQALTLSHQGRGDIRGVARGCVRRRWGRDF